MLSLGKWINLPESHPALYSRLRVEVDITPESFSEFLVINITYNKRRTVRIYLAKHCSKLFQMP